MVWDYGVFGPLLFDMGFGLWSVRQSENPNFLIWKVDGLPGTVSHLCLSGLFLKTLLCVRLARKEGWLVVSDVSTARKEKRTWGRARPGLCVLNEQRLG